MKKICFLTTGDITAIATMKRAIGMANPLLDLGWNVSIIALDCEENRKRIALECSEGVEVYYYEDGDFRAEAAQKTRMIEQIQPHYIYFCSFSARNMIRKSALSFSPQMIIEHSELRSGIADNKGWRRVMSWMLECWSVVYADQLVCASRYLERFYRKRSGQLFKRRLPILYSPYAYNNEVLDHPKVLINELKEQYRNKTVLVYMGGMARNYGLFVMIKAVEIAVRQAPSIKLLLMGRGRHLEEAKAYVQENALEDHVTFLGYVPETALSSYLGLADAFISPLNDSVQDWARCPSKIYMYMPFNKPIFTCKIGEPKEIFGENGHYFDTTDPASLAALMLQLAQKEIPATDLRIEEHSWNRRSADFTAWISEQVI